MPRLTEKQVAALTPPAGKREAWLSDAEAPGLRVRAMAGGKSFYVAWTDRATGERRRERLGTWGSITLEQARSAARVILGDVAKNLDPAKVRQERREAAEAAKAEAAFTLAALIADWSRLHLAARRPRYSTEATRALRHAFHAHLDKPAAALTHAAVVATLDRLAGAGKPATARLTQAYGRAAYGWALKRRRLAVNPFAGLPVIEGGPKARDRVLDDQELGEVWRASRSLPAPYGPMIRLAFATAARRDEIAGATWGEIAPDFTAWTQPAARVKNGRPHIVHLSDAAREALREMLPADGGPMPAADRLVFSLDGRAPVSGHSWVKRKLDAAIAAARAAGGGDAAPMPPWVLHDARRSAVTWLAGAGFPPHVCDRLLNHVGGTISGVAAVYQRSEFLPERKAALDAWGAHLIACADGAEAGVNVVAITEGRARRSA